MNSTNCKYIVGMKFTTRGPWVTSITWENTREEDLNFIDVILLFRNYLPLEKGVALHLDKTESPLPKDALCQVWLKLAHGSGEENL